MTDQPEAPHLGASWPEAYADILPVIQREWGVEGNIYLTRQLAGGKSGALVFFVDISTRAFAGQAILKLDHADDSTEEADLEAALHARAIEDAPDFAKEHLPRLLHSAHVGDQLAILSTIAGRGLEYVEPWMDCSYQRQLQSIRYISTELLETWNHDYRLSTGLVAPRELMRAWLEYRHDPAKGGRIHAFLADECGISPETPTITYDGHWYPNPLAFVTGDSTIPKKLDLRAVVGRGHGDFHGMNLLVGRSESEPLEYYIIDLAMYESEQFLFYDHAYFEVANLLFSRGGASARDWEAIVARIRRFEPAEEPPELRMDDIGLIGFVEAVRGGITDWIERREADRLSFMESQVLLSRVAAGLSFSHKRMSLESRQMAFFYAAANLKDYMKLHRVEWSKMGPDFVIGSKSPSPPELGTELRAAALARISAAERAKRHVPEAPQTRARRHATLGVAALAVAAICIAIVAFSGRGLFWAVEENAISGETGGPSTPTGSPDAAQPTVSLAILPFRNLDPSGDQGFADGLTIELASVFARTGSFRMPRINAAFQFRDNADDTRAIGEALNVDYLVEGTVRKSGDDLWVAASLVRAEDDFLIWSQTFNQRMEDVFLAQESIANAIGSALATPLNINADVLEARRTDDPEAYELFVRGLALLAQRGQDLEEAEAVLQRAVEISPDFAAAWGALSLTYRVIPSYLTESNGRPVSPVAYYRRSTEAARRAAAIDPDLSLVRHALAQMHQRQRQWIAAQDEYEAALRFNPTAASTILDYSTVLYIVGKRAEAMAQLDQALELDPFETQYHLWNAALRLQSDPTEDNLRTIENIFDHSPTFQSYALRYIIDYHASNGEIERARDLINTCSNCSVILQKHAISMLDAALVEPAEKIFERYKDTNFVGYEFLYSIGGAELVLDAFYYYAIGARRRYGYQAVPWSLADVLSEEPRFLQIADDMGLVSYWRERGDPDNCKLTDEGALTCDERGAG